VAAVLVALFVYAQLVPGSKPLTTREVDQRVASALASQTPGPGFASEVYSTIAPSLVFIQVKSPTPADPNQGGVGSGVVVTDAGDILTANHVVENATEITLTFADGSKSTAKIVAQQPEQDIAVVRADQPPANLPPAVLGDPNLPIGSEAYVVGNPYGLYGSMSAGVISGRGRTFKRPGRDVTISNLIQVDAAVNPGNSGGPLLDRGGRVIGIVVALINPTEDDVFIGIGLAVPIDVAGGAAGLPPF
jgi:S1-C subfamily serine protease